MLVAPLGANSLAKFAHGQCDTLIVRSRSLSANTRGHSHFIPISNKYGKTCVVRAWDFAQPLLLAPAMNTLMWEHVFTAQQLDIMRTLGASVIPPISKTLMCGDAGVGAMASVDTLVERIRALDKQLRAPKGSIEC